MLVFSRRRDAEVVIDFASMTDQELQELRKTPIVMQVVDIRGDKVRLGTTAPKCVQVHRKEIFNALQREGRMRVSRNGSV